MGALLGGGSSGPTPEEIEAEAAAKRKQDTAAARSRAVSRLSRRGTASLTFSPTSTGLNIPGSGDG